MQINFLPNTPILNQRKYPTKTNGVHQQTFTGSREAGFLFETLESKTADDLCGFFQKLLKKLPSEKTEVNIEYKKSNEFFRKLSTGIIEAKDKTAKFNKILGDALGIAENDYAQREFASEIFKRHYVTIEKVEKYSPFIKMFKDIDPKKPATNHLNDSFKSSAYIPLPKLFTSTANFEELERLPHEELSKRINESAKLLENIDIKDDSGKEFKTMIIKLSKDIDNSEKSFLHKVADAMGVEGNDPERDFSNFGFSKLIAKQRQKEEFKDVFKVLYSDFYIKKPETEKLKK